MKERTYTLIAPALLFIITVGSLFLSTAHAQTETAPSGSGTSASPHIIANLNNLAWLQDVHNDSAWGDYYLQTADIDASSDTSWNSGAGFTPIGGSGNSFAGTYDGGGHTISGLFISLSNSPWSVGMFASLYGGATVKNLGLVNVNITGATAVGGLAGIVNFSTVQNCYVSGTVHGSGTQLGGLVGEASGTTNPSTIYAVITNSHSSAAVTGDSDDVGGLIGSLGTLATVTGSYSTGNVESTNPANQYTGGLIGYASLVTSIRTSYSTGNVTGKNYVGGLVGIDNGVNTTSSVIDSSYATGTVSGATYVGGFIGESIETGITNSHSSGRVLATGNYSGGFVGDNISASTVSDCYCTGSDSGASDAGGFLGAGGSFASVTASYSTGKCQGGSNVGGFAGYIYNHGISNCYSMDTVIATGSGVGGFVGEDQGAGVDKCYSTGSVTGGSLVGGLIGDNIGGSTNSLWDTQTSGQSSSSYGDIAATTSQMQTQSTYTTYSWDFTSTWAIDPGINGGFPGFAWQSQYAPAAPSAATGAGTGITWSSVTLNGNVSPHKDTTTVKFVYGTSSGVYPDTVAATQSPIYGYGPISVSKAISSLTASTTYYYRVIASNLLGPAVGSELSFTTTAAPSAPTAMTDSVSSIASTTAISYGTVNPNGDTTTVRFLYGTVSGTYHDSVVATQSPLTGYSSTHVTANLSGLTPGQTYYLRVSASSILSYERGSEISFTTVASTETAPSGSGTSSDPHIIAGLDNLKWLQDASNDTAWGDYYKQTANINASPTSTWNSGTGLSPIGNSSTPFSGSYDGQGHTIDSLHISRTGSNYQGLFGTLGSSAVVESLGVTNASVSGNDFVGALAGWVESGASVTSCYTSGSVYAGHGDCGGLIGESDGTVATSFSNCNITGGSVYSMGGFIGYTDGGSITNCYSTGRVNVSCAGAGGLVGNHTSAAIDDCYSVSKVSAPNTYGGLIGGNYGGSVTGSFYNTDSTGSSAAGTGETSADMKTESTYTGASWDFISTWAINGSINSGYPYLPAVDHSLPVQATNFVATADVGSVTLSWKTQSELANAGFNILREDPGTSTFKLISSYTSNDSLKGLGTSSAGRIYNFTDSKVISGDTYRYKIQSVSTGGTTKDLSTLSVTVDVPKTYALYQNYPNPFNPSTTIRFDLKQASNVTLEIYNTLGQRVEKWSNGVMGAGRYNEVVNMSRYASGIYFYRITAIGINGERFIETKKMLELK
ncbi:MAG TPA: GLUG motif-containing protein [Candidatus Kryptonia bacterium]